MAESAHLADPHVAVGLVAADGGPVVLPLLTSLQLAKEYALTGERIPARRAAEIGLVNHVCPDGEVMEQALACAHKIAARAAPVRSRTRSGWSTSSLSLAGGARLRAGRRGPLVHLTRAAGQHRAAAQARGLNGRRPCRSGHAGGRRDSNQPASASPVVRTCASMSWAPPGHRHPRPRRRATPVRSTRLRSSCWGKSSK